MSGLFMGPMGGEFLILETESIKIGGGAWGGDIHAQSFPDELVFEHKSFK